jgi:hypothetical protein
VVLVKKLLGVADIAAMCGVEAKTVSIWRLRYSGFPEPDATVGEIAGWDPARAEEIRAWMDHRPGRGRKAPPAPHVQEALRRVFVYNFMRPDDFASAPIDFPGAQYDDDGMLSGGMQAKATAHLIDAIRQRGYDLVFDDPATDPVAVMHHILWDKWTEDEIGEYQFIGRLFNERGQIYHGCTAFDAANYTLQRLTAFDGEIRSCAGPVQLPWWAGNPPEEAGPFLEVIERLRTLAWAQVDGTLRDMAAAGNMNSILQRQANAMDAMRTSVERPRSAVLLPDFAGEDYSSLETAVLALVPTDPEELAGIEQGVEAASADSENRKLLAQITERLPSRIQLARLTPWAVFVMVSLEVLKEAPEINPNDIGMLTMILMVVLYLLPPHVGS